MAYDIKYFIFLIPLTQVKALFRFSFKGNQAEVIFRKKSRYIELMGCDSTLCYKDAQYIENQKQLGTFKNYLCKLNLSQDWFLPKRLHKQLVQQELEQDNKGHCEQGDLLYDEAPKFQSPDEWANCRRRFFLYATVGQSQELRPGVSSSLTKSPNSVSMDRPTTRIWQRSRLLPVRYAVRNLISALLSMPLHRFPSSYCMRVSRAHWMSEKKQK